MNDRDRERQRDARRKREASLDAREVEIPACENRRRRVRYEAKGRDADWLRYYFGEDSGCPDPFWYKFTSQQLEMIEAIRHAIVFGGDQSLAASRGEGKTTLAERMLLKYVLQGVLRFGVLCAATGTAAANSLDSIKSALETNDRLLADYPEVCAPIRALENTPNRAHYQVVTGQRHDNGEPFFREPSKFSWCGQQVVLPVVPGSPASGAVVATRGLDAAVRGLKIRGRRPDLVLIDDPDTEDTARSEEQAKKLADRIDRALGGLGGQQRGVGRIMLTTLQSRVAVSYRFTDPAQKPTWKGQRFRFLVKPPDRMELWDEYVQMVQANLQEGDEFARGAHRFFRRHRRAMEAGAVVANPNRFNPAKLPDGSQLEFCALQRYFNEVARIGPQAVATEYDNDPPEEMGPVESGLTAHKIQRRLSGYPRGIVPPDCKVLTQGMDIQKAGGYWVVRAWRPDATAFTIDYGFEETHGTVYGSDEGVEKAVVRMIQARMEFLQEHPYTDVEGNPVEVALTLVDSGWQSSAVYFACRKVGLGIRPSKGFGKSNGCVQMAWRPSSKRTKDRQPGDGWFLGRQDDGTWLVSCDADRWKAFEHARWLTPVEKPGAMTIFGERAGEKGRLSEDERAHHSYAHHVVAEVEVEEEVKGILKRYWKAKHVRNHWFDASYLSDVGAAMKGIRLLSLGQGATVKLSELQKNRRARRG